MRQGLLLRKLEAQLCVFAQIHGSPTDPLPPPHQVLHASSSGRILPGAGEMEAVSSQGALSRPPERLTAFLPSPGRSKGTPATLTAHAVHILQTHPCHQQAHQGHGDELHRRLFASGLPRGDLMSLGKLRAVPWPILQCPEL